MCYIYICIYTYNTFICIYIHIHVHSYITPISTTTKSELWNPSDSGTLLWYIYTRIYIYIYRHTRMHTDFNHGKKRTTQSLRHWDSGTLPGTLQRYAYTRIYIYLYIHMYAHRVKPRQKARDTIFEALGLRKFAIFARVPWGIFGLFARIEFVRFVHCRGGDIVRPSPNIDLIICVYIYVYVCVYIYISTMGVNSRVALDTNT